MSWLRPIPSIVFDPIPRPEAKYRMPVITRSTEDAPRVGGPAISDEKIAKARELDRTHARVQIARMLGVHIDSLRKYLGPKAYWSRRRAP